MAAPPQMGYLSPNRAAAPRDCVADRHYGTTAPSSRLADWGCADFHV